MFTKEQRSTFPYWFAHWCAFQMTALNHGMWKFKYLFHDIEKPWLKLIWSYPRVQHWHRTHSKHHLEYYMLHEKADWKAMVIDWECARFTKSAQPRNAVEELQAKMKDYPTLAVILDINISPILINYGFKERL